ncbi:hypothetical protein PR202_gb00621 [Eleusine coracana subsp. coracana]|uniref:Uncharacterized protein n=1 Tax=Eleusine coracana subsp. coracana TaxID=191504 RepID=A0AAV5DVB2_ELECO|nr:hypothetical protein PR202_gb00621 [Eleusine coracana subsp. coracana]
MSEEAPPSSPATMQYVEGCPGCAMERKKQTCKGIPYKELFFVAITSIATALPISALFPFLYFMAYSIEVSPPEHQALGLSIVSTGWGIGLVLGPSIGGYLARPALQYPNIVSEESLFGRFPYLLPCLCISIFSVAVLVSCMWLPETLHKHKNIENMGGMSGDSRTQQTEDIHLDKSLYKNKPLMSSIIAYSVFTLHDTAYSEVRAGLLVYQLFFYRAVHKFLGSVYSCRIASVLSIPLLAAYPFMKYLSGFELGLAIYPATIVKGVFGVSFIYPYIAIPFHIY